MKARVLLSSAFLTAFVLVANAPSIAAPTPVPDMKPDLSAMNFFMGTWKCTAMIRGKSRPDTATTSLSMDGRWITTHERRSSLRSVSHAPDNERHRDDL